MDTRPVARTNTRCITASRWTSSNPSPPLPPPGRDAAGALASSSPLWRGEPTGVRSSRHMVLAAFPRSGPPPRFNDYADYAELVGQLERTGCIADYTHIWWDIRLHPRLGTIEIRIC